MYNGYLEEDDQFLAAEIELEYNIYYKHHQSNIQQHKNHFHKNIVENFDKFLPLSCSSNPGLARNIFESLIRHKVLKGSSRCRNLSRLGRLRLRRCIGSQKQRSIWLEPGKVREISGNFLVWSFLCLAYVVNFEYYVFLGDFSIIFL